MVELYKTRVNGKSVYLINGKKTTYKKFRKQKRMLERGFATGKIIETNSGIKIHPKFAFLPPYIPQITQLGLDYI